MLDTIFRLEIIVLGVVVIGVMALVISGRQDRLFAPLSAPDPMRVEPRLPAGDITAEDIAGLRFASAVRGYRHQQVDQLLEEIQQILISAPTKQSELLAKIERIEATRFPMDLGGYDAGQVDEIIDEVVHKLRNQAKAYQDSTTAGE